MAQVKIYLLGTSQIERDGVPVSTDRRKALALLAYLAVTAQPQTRDALATLLWPDYDTASSYAYLRRTLWEINQLLGPGWLKTERDQVGLKQADGLWLDAAAFLTHLNQFRHAPIGPEPLAAAVTLYRDHFLAGFSLRDSEAFDTWQQFQMEQFRRELAWALEQLATLYRELQSWDSALAYAQRWLALDPLQEAAHRQLMQIYTGMGDRAAAIRQYERCAQRLKAEMGLAPSADTVALWQEIRNEPNVPRLRPAVPPPTVTPTPHHQLPTPPTPFVGRKSELAEIEHLLTTPDSRLVTLIGPGERAKPGWRFKRPRTLTRNPCPGAMASSLCPWLPSVHLIPWCPR